MYLDPGFGGMLVQALVLIAAVGGAIVFSFRKKLGRLFSSRKMDQPQPTEGMTDFQPTAAGADDAIDMLDN